MNTKFLKLLLLGLGLLGATPWALAGKTISVSSAHGCSVTDKGKVVCWGTNTTGQVSANASVNFLPNASAGTEIDGLSMVRAVTTGVNFSCALLDNSQARCWGSNAANQLGDGGASPGGKGVPPVVVTAGGQPVTAIKQLSAGDSHVCALLIDGTVACWGRNAEGQIGQGGLSSTAGPLRVRTTAGGANLTSIVSIDSGARHTCALSSNGSIFCWGDNTSGQLGRGTKTTLQTTDANATITLPLGAGIIPRGIAAGAAHTCVIADDTSVVPAKSTVRCWGANNGGQLGWSTNVSEWLVPTAIQNENWGVNIPDELSLGNLHSCVRFVSGGVQCWGWNSTGQLGNGLSQQNSVPQTVTAINTTGNAFTLSNVIELDAGSGFNCVRTKTDNIRCWGKDFEVANVVLGMLGDNDDNSTESFKSRAVSVLSQSQGMVSVVAGNSHACALIGSEVGTGNRVKCWGSASSGQIGNGTVGLFAQALRPVNVTGLDSEVIQISSGTNHTCAIKEAGAIDEIWCWGDNANTKLGNGNTTDQSIPIKIANPPGNGNPVQLALGDNHTCVRTSLGEVYCLGRGNEGQVGLGVPLPTSPVTAFTKVQVINSVTQIAAGANHTCAVLSDQTVWCWGLSNAMQQVQSNSNVPVPAQMKDPNGNNLAGVTRIAVGNNHSCVVTGLTICWGDNSALQLGNANSAQVAPFFVRDASNQFLQPAEIYSGPSANHNCAVFRSAASGFVDSMKCWGDNSNSQLGPDPVLVGKTSYHIPTTAFTAPAAFLPVQTAAASSFHTCIAIGFGIQSDATNVTKCWGVNQKGVLGINNSRILPWAEFSAPQNVMGKAYPRDSIFIDWFGGSF